MNLGHQLGAVVREAVREQPPSGFWHQIGREAVEWIRVWVEEYDPVRFEMWDTMLDERTCPICGQLEGNVWQEGEGFYPPAHDYCRCQRIYHHVEFQVRYVERWEQRITTTYEWEWQRTYW